MAMGKRPPSSPTPKRRKPVATRLTVAGGRPIVCVACASEPWPVTMLRAASATLTSYGSQKPNDPRRGKKSTSASAASSA